MKKYFIKWLLQLIVKENQPPQHIKVNKPTCGVTYKEGYFFLTAPNGEIIPNQTFFSLSDAFPNKGLAEVTIKVNVFLASDNLTINV